MKKFLFVVFFLVVYSASYAADISRHFTGIRPLGMGGAFTAVANDENALFYNPAGLDRVEKFSFALINPYAQVGENGLDAFEDFSDADMDKTSEVADVLRKHMGKNINLKVAAMPYFVKHRFGLSLLGQAEANFEARNPAFPEMKVDTKASGSVNVGYGRQVLKSKLKDRGEFRVGFGLKFVHMERLSRIYTSADIASNNFEDTLDDDLMKGSGLGFDLGTMYTFNTKFKPTVALAVNDFTDTDMGDAGEIPQTLNFGVSATHKLAFVDLTAAFDWRDITANAGEDSDVFKRLHMGLEAKMPILTLRTGLYQGYGSFGASINFKLLKLEYANYAEELGSFAGQKVDRRHVAQISLGWF